jgi:hypothetical protein
MLSIKECKEVLGDEFDDDDVEQIRDSLYRIAMILTQNYYETEV